MTETSTYDKLVEHGIHPSMQRIAIMDYLDNHHTHPTVEEVYDSLIGKIPTLSRTTVYNTLRLFAEQNAAQLLTIDERKACFDGNPAPHAHFLCKKCGRVLDLPIEGVEGWETKPEGYKVDELHLYYKGICKDCLEAETAKQ